MTQQRLGLVFPVPEIVRTSSRSDSSPDPDVAPPTGIDADSVHGTPMDSLPMAQMLSASLEDVGDEQAARMGISHDPQGYVKHR